MILAIVPSWFVEVPIDVSGCVGGHLRASRLAAIEFRRCNDVDARAEHRMAHLASMEARERELSKAVPAIGRIVQ
jgi:hypothetical protein